MSAIALRNLFCLLVLLTPSLTQLAAGGKSFDFPVDRKKCERIDVQCDLRVQYFGDTCACRSCHEVVKAFSCLPDSDTPPFCTYLRKDGSCLEVMKAFAAQTTATQPTWQPKIAWRSFLHAQKSSKSILTVPRTEKRRHSDILIAAASFGATLMFLLLLISLVLLLAGFYVRHQRRHAIQRQYYAFHGPAAEQCTRSEALTTTPTSNGDMLVEDGCPAVNISLPNAAKPQTVDSANLLQFQGKRVPE